MPIPPHTPAECFATLIAWLGRAVAARGGGDRLSLRLIALVIDRLRFINERVARVVARIRAGRYAVRTVSPHRRAAGLRRANPLPQEFGWLLQLVPEAVGSRSQLEHLLLDPGMAELMAAAPVSLGRPLRSLCRMLGLRPPQVLAVPARPRPPRLVPPVAPAPPPPGPPSPQPPAWMPKRTRWTLSRMRGPPNRV
jgi:hypothetical protein